MPSRSARAALIALVGAAVVAGVQLGGGATSLGQRLLVMGLLLAASGVLWWRDRAPVVVLASTAAAAVAYYLVGGPPGPEPVPFVVALYGVARAGYRRLAIVAVPVATLAVVLADQFAARVSGVSRWRVAIWSRSWRCWWPPWGWASWPGPATVSAGHCGSRLPGRSGCVSPVSCTTPWPIS